MSKKMKSFDEFLLAVKDGYNFSIKPFINKSFSGGYTSFGRIGEKEYGMTIIGENKERKIEICEIYNSQPTAEFSLAETLTQHLDKGPIQLFLTAEERRKTLLSKFPNSKVKILTNKGILNEKEKEKAYKLARKNNLLPFGTSEIYRKIDPFNQNYLIKVITEPSLFLGIIPTGDNYYVQILNTQSGESLEKKVGKSKLASSFPFYLRIKDIKITKEGIVIRTFNEWFGEEKKHKTFFIPRKQFPN